MGNRDFTFFAVGGNNPRINLVNFFESVCDLLIGKDHLSDSFCV